MIVDPESARHLLLGPVQRKSVDPQVVLAVGSLPTCRCKSHRGRASNPRVGKISWRRAQQPTPVVLPGESHGQSSLEGYQP